MLETKDLYWLAGLLEGEGSFGATKDGAYPNVCLKMNDKDVVFKAHKLLRPAIYRKNGNDIAGPIYDKTRLSPTAYYKARVGGACAACI